MERKKKSHIKISISRNFNQINTTAENGIKELRSEIDGKQWEYYLH